jgi:plastocyanin
MEVRMQGIRLLVSATFLIAACGGSDGPSTPPPGEQTGSLAGTVSLNGVGTGSGAVEATRTGSTSRSATPGATGAYTIGGLATGGWTLQYTPGTSHRLADGETGTRTATVTANQTTTVSPFLIAVAGPQSGLVEVRLTGGLQFAPQVITITPGTTVRWINDSTMDHTITPENTGQAGVWARRVMNANAQGATFEHTFTASGQTYRYRCEPHSSGFTSGMVGTIIVT